MKRVSRLFLAFMLCGTGLAQGTILFFNGDISVSGGGVYQAPIFFYELRSEDFTAGLFLSGSKDPLATTPFLENSGFFATAKDVAIPGYAPGSTPGLLVRVWQTAAGSYENSSVRGESALFTSLPLGGPYPPNPPIPTPDMRGFQGFPMGIPEPSTILLGAVGLGMVGLLLRHSISLPTVSYSNHG